MAKPNRLSQDPVERAEHKAKQNSKNCHRAQRRRRLRYLAGYGGKCTCCGETRFEFLEVHHVQGGGSKDRKVRPGSLDMRDQLRNNFPPGREVLCSNCHQSITKYGYCPHKGRPDGVYLPDVALELQNSKITDY
jgi:hypothetical protein